MTMTGIAAKGFAVACITATIVACTPQTEPVEAGAAAGCSEIYSALNRLDTQTLREWASLEPGSAQAELASVDQDPAVSPVVRELVEATWDTGTRLLTVKEALTVFEQSDTEADRERVTKLRDDVEQVQSDIDQLRQRVDTVCGADVP